MIKSIFISFVALLHVYFLVLEMFLWTTKTGLKTFQMSAEKAKETASLAANQGLYNGFLAAGLIWSLLHPDQNTGQQISIFFLLCVVIAGIYGGYSVNRKIFFIQSVPALMSLALVILS